MQTDGLLLQRYAHSRDPEAFAELVRRHAGMVYRTCIRSLGNPHDAEDVAQEAFLELARKAASVAQSVPGWLHTVASRRARDAVRDGATRRRHEEACMGGDRGADESTWHEIAPHVDRALADLPQELRAPLVLHYLEDEKLTSPEFLTIHRFDALKEGRLDDALKYYLDKSRDAAAKRFGDVQAVKDSREKVSDVVFRARIRFGDMLYVKYKMIVPGDWSPTWMAAFLKADDGWRFLEPPEETVLNTLAHGCPYWLPEQERTFSPDAGMAEIAVPSPTGAEPKAKTVSRIYVALRKLGPEAKGLTDFFGKVVRAYREGTDDEVVKLWKEEWREGVAVALEEATSGGDVEVSVTVRIAGETVPGRSETPEDLRAFFRKHAAVEPVCTVDGEKTVYLYHRAPGDRSPGGLRLLRLARTALDGFVLTEHGEDQSVADGILASPFFTEALAKLHSKSAGPGSAPLTPMAGSSAPEHTDADLSDTEEARLTRIAEDRCGLMNLDTKKRTATVAVDGQIATVTFHLPKGYRGGSFIFKIDRTTGRIVDTKIWR